MKIIKNLLFWIPTACLFLLILLIAVPKLFGVEFRAVLTGSMTPEIPVGSLVVIVPTEAADIEIGDDITFVTQGDMVVTHRVVDINRETNEFTTWGIANDKTAVDAPNQYENIIGVVRLHIPFLGQVFSWIATLQGKIIAATAIIAVYIISSIISIWSINKKVEKENTKEETDNASDPENQRFDTLLHSIKESEALFREEMNE